MGWTFKDWYARNSDTLNAKRKDRYHTDPEYREKVLEQNRLSRKKKKQLLQESKENDEDNTSDDGEDEE
jgi:hypothetical protein